VPDVPAPEFIALQRALAGRYSLERELGRGGMGVVFLARDVALDRPVAIKLLPPAMAAQAALRQRFLREAQLAAKLSHPNIIPIFAVGEVDDFVFFVMAYVDGQTLGHRIQSRGPMTPAEGTRMIQEVAWALAYAHLRGIVHRDVKPDNILLEQGTGRALVSDFGIARLADASGGTAVGEVLGTAQYMSPEQATGEKLDGRSDLYALGVVAFYALSGRLPFDAPDVPALLAMHITRPAPPLASVAAGVPGKLAQAVDRCLAKDPAERFQTGEQLAEAVAASTAVAREVPAPIRVWLQRGAPAKGPIAVWTAIGVIAAVGDLAAGRAMGGDNLLIFFGPLAVYGLVRASFTRRVLAAGYGLDDIRLALRERAAQAREELAFETSVEPTVVGKTVRWVTLAALATSVASAGAIALLPEARTIPVLLTWVWSTVVTAAGAIVGRIVPGRRVTPRDPARSLQSRLWSGKAGEWVVRLAGWKLKRPALPAPSAHRPTEIAIGLAAAALFDALPKETRKALGDLPAVIQRLEADALGLRARVDELNALLAGAGEESIGAQSSSLRLAGAATSGALGSARERLRRELAGERDGVAQQLATSVAALENIRLDLLRLTAGVGTVDQVSADLTAARRIGTEVDAMLAGRREVEALLAPPPRPRD
jgi:serine/threonine-protein kinase